MKELKYSFEYFCSPIWINNKEDLNSVFENIDIDLLQVSDSLKREIIELDLIYQSTYNEEYPPVPKCLAKREWLLFIKRVLKSSEQLTEELVGKYTILFDKKKLGRFYE